MELPPPLSGYLTKRGHVVKSWKRRWVVLEMGVISYFSDETTFGPTARLRSKLSANCGPVLKGTMSLASAVTGGRSESDPVKIYLIDTETEIELYLRADTPEDAENWERHIEQHILFAKNKKLSQTKAPSLDKSLSAMSDQNFEDPEQEPSTPTSLHRVLSDDIGSITTPDPGSQLANAELLAFENFDDTSTSDDSNRNDLDLAEWMKNMNISRADDGKTVLSGTLIELGKEIKRLEAECKKDQEATMKEFTKVEVPILKDSIKTYDLRIASLKKRIKSESSRGDDHVKTLSDELDSVTALQDKAKASLYFPSSVIKFGSGGVYIALDDFWLEKLSGNFNLQLAPASGESPPKISFDLSGSTSNVSGSVSEEGMEAVLLIGGFKLKGDSGKGVPPLSFDHLHLAVSIKLNVTLNYNPNFGNWYSSSDQFKIQILSFKGPFGINRGLINALLTIAVPIIRIQLLKLIPPELGMWIGTLSSPINVSGNFNISGSLSISEFSKSMYKSEKLCSILDYSSQQLLLFVAMQKSMIKSHHSVVTHSPCLSTVQDLLAYRREFEKHSNWSKIKSLWDLVAVSFFSSLMDNSSKSESINPGDIISFEKLMLGLSHLLKNPVKIDVALHKLEASLGLYSVCLYALKFFERIFTELISSKAKMSEETTRFMAQVFDVLGKGRDQVQLLERSLDYVNCTAGIRMEGGPDGELRLLVQNIEAQAPMGIMMSLPKQMNMAYDYIVPMMINLKTHKEGAINVKIYHLGGPSLLEALNFENYLNKMAESAVSPTGLSAATLKKSTDGSEQPMRGIEAEQRHVLEQYVANMSKPQQLIDELLNVKLDAENGAEEIFHVRVVQPLFRFVVDQGEALTLDPNSPLFTVQVGPAASIGKLHVDVPPLLICKGDDFMSDPSVEDDDGGCPLLIQTQSKVKIKIQIPEIRIRAVIVNLLRFVNAHFGDIDSLTHAIAVMMPIERPAILAYVEFAQLVLAVVHRYLLSPDRFGLSVNIFLRILTCSKEGVMFVLKTPSETLARQNIFKSSGNAVQVDAVKLRGIVNIGELAEELILLSEEFMKLGSHEVPSTMNSMGKFMTASGNIVDSYELRITKISCKNLANADSFFRGRSAPFLHLKFGEVILKTTQKRHEASSCEWVLGEDDCMESMKFRMTRDDVTSGFDIIVSVLNGNSKQNQEVIGEGLSKKYLNSENSSETHVLDLFTKKYEPAGTVTIEFDCIVLHR